VIQRAVSIGMRALEQFDDLFSARSALCFGFSHPKMERGHPCPHSALGALKAKASPPSRSG